VVIIESVLGNSSDPEWVSRLATARLDVLALDQWEAQKNRFRKRTAAGTEVAVSLDQVVVTGTAGLTEQRAMGNLLEKVQTEDVLRTAPVVTS